MMIRPVGAGRGRRPGAQPHRAAGLAGVGGAAACAHRLPARGDPDHGVGGDGAGGCACGKLAQVQLTAIE